jgi:hypothetical protein
LAGLGVFGNIPVLLGGQDRGAGLGVSKSGSGGSGGLKLGFGSTPGGLMEDEISWSSSGNLATG